MVQLCRDDSTVNIVVVVDVVIVEWRLFQRMEHGDIGTRMVGITFTLLHCVG